MLNSSFSTKDVHTNDKNGVMYARFDIFAVSPDSSAIIHIVLATAIVKIPFHATPVFVQH